MAICCLLVIWNIQDGGQVGGHFISEIQIGQRITLNTIFACFCSKLISVFLVLLMPVWTSIIIWGFKMASKIAVSYSFHYKNHYLYLPKQKSK